MKKMLESFKQITLHESKQEASQICLQNMVELIIERKEELFAKETECELIECFPLVGLGLKFEQIIKKNQMRYRVTTISRVERIVDDSVLFNTNKLRLKDKPNCILPLLSEEENNRELLRCELFKRKMSYLLLHCYTKYEEKSYIILIQSTLKYLIKSQGGFLWQESLKDQIFATCKQVFVGENYFCYNIASPEFEQSKFKLLNAYCLWRMNQTTYQEIFVKLIKSKLNRANIINQSKQQLQQFFSQLTFAHPEEIFKNVEEYIQEYLESNQYFYFLFVQKSYQLNLIREFTPDYYLNDIFYQIPYINGQNLTLEESENRQLIKGYVKASVYTKLLHYLIRENSGPNIEKFQIIADSVDSDMNYKTFLQNNQYFDFLYQIPDLLMDQNESEFIKYAISLVPKNKIFSLKEDKIKSSDEILMKLLNNCPEFCQGRQILKNLIQIFQFQENEEELMQKIYRILSGVIWLNNSVNETRFIVNQKIQQMEIQKLLQIFQDYEEGEDYDYYPDAYEYNLNDISKFCFDLKLKTDNFKKYILENLEDFEDERSKTMSCEKFQICGEIFKISKEYFKN